MKSRKIKKNRLSGTSCTPLHSLATPVSVGPNIALIKYWGKRDEKFFLPTKSSLSVTLSDLKTETCVCILRQAPIYAKATMGRQDERFVGKQKFARGDHSISSWLKVPPEVLNEWACPEHRRGIEPCEREISEDEIIINGKTASKNCKQKIVNFLNIFRSKYKIKNSFKIVTKNNFPTAAGLASSASGFAALTQALNKTCNLNLSKKELSILARQGSGSACRSIYDGFVLWNKGEKKEGSDSFAQQLFDKNHWPEFRILVVIVDSEKKKISSRDAMQITVKTSPFYKKWIKESEKRIPEMIQAIKNKDFKTVGELAQVDCLDMHKTMQTSKPEINYFKPLTLQVMQKVNELRMQGLPCYFAIDAGHNVKVLCLQRDCSKIKNVMQKINGVKQVIACKVG